LNINQLHCICM